jgi:hypothetical protein
MNCSIRFVLRAVTTILFSLGLTLVGGCAPSASAQSKQFEAFVSIKPHGQFTWNYRLVPNYLDLSALFSANSGRQPKPIVKIWQCQTACPTRIESVEQLAKHYGFDSYILVVQRVGVVPL